MNSKRSKKILKYKIIITLICFIFIILAGYIYVNANCRLIIRNKVVIGMKEGIFQKLDEITSVQIPNGVEEIGEEAFFSNYYLKNIEIPSSVTKIGERAFLGCTALEEVNIPDGVKIIEERTFAFCESLEEVELPGSVIKINDQAFSASKLRKIEIPTSVEHIRARAFAGCVGLEEVILHENIISVGRDAFYYTSWQNSLEIGEGNTFYSDGILLGAWSNGGLDETTINAIVERIIYEDLEEFQLYDGILNEPGRVVRPNMKIKEGTRLLADSALQDCYFLHNIELPESIEIIGNEAFSNCYALEEIIIPTNVKMIGEDVFDGCKNLKIIRVPVHLKEDFQYNGYANIIYY